MPHYLTPEGAKRYAAELNKLLGTERPRIVQEVQEAAAQGDRSENAEYIYGKKRLREIDSRVRFLRQRLEGMTVVEEPPKDRSRVFFGAWVTVEDEDGTETTYRIVGPDEADVRAGKLSVESPLARALLGKELGESVQVERPRGAVEYTVGRVSYVQPTH
jgi:transcription elongation factor GreB